MTDERLERELRSWLGDEAARLRLPGALEEDVLAIASTGSASPVPERVVARLGPSLRISRPWRGMRSAAPATVARLLAAAGLVAIVAVVTLNVLSSVAPPQVGASPSASPGATLRPADRPVPGSMARFIDQISFSFQKPASWESPGSEYPNYISRSVTGPQGAEGQVLWAGYPATGTFAAECAYLRDLNPAATVAALADAVASVPGTDLVSRSDVTVGGRPATKIVLFVRDDVGCDPGFFFHYPTSFSGALWPETMPGDTVRVWIVDVGGPRLLVIEGKTHPVNSSILEEQIQAIVDSISFD